MKTTIDMAREAELVYWLPNSTYTDGRWWMDAGEPGDELKAFEALVRADEREQIKDEWWMCVQSDLEHGVKSLNELAARKWDKEYPEISKFGGWLNARGETK
jgi:hypothetical protein